MAFSSLPGGKRGSWRLLRASAGTGECTNQSPSGPTKTLRTRHETGRRRMLQLAKRLHRRHTNRTRRKRAFRHAWCSSRLLCIPKRRLRCILTNQCSWRRMRARKWLRVMLDAKRLIFLQNLLLVQAQSRGFLARRGYVRDVARTMRIQRVVRGHLSRVRCHSKRAGHMAGAGLIVPQYPELGRLLAVYTTPSCSAWIKHRCEARDCERFAEVPATSLPPHTVVGRCGVGEPSTPFASFPFARLPFLLSI